MRLLYYKFLSIIVLSFCLHTNIYSDTPVTLFDSYAGDLNFVGVDGTRRTSLTNACAVLAENVTNTAVITGIPASATIRAAHLYWAGSFSTQAGSTRTTPDYTVTFEGNTITAPLDRQYTANYSVGPFSLDFYSGVADVTAQVDAERNGTYSFSGLSVNTATQHCQTASVSAGWSLLIIYEDSSEDFRVVNLFEGFQAFRGSSVTRQPGNFEIPVAPINGKHGAITWEGDAGNSAILNGFSENISYNGTSLTDATNPLAAQFNSRSNIRAIAPSTGAVNNNSFGIDFDIYNVDPLLSAGDTSVNTVYSSGGDLVLLSAEISSVTNTPVSDLGITKTAGSIFNVGENAIYNITVNNVGPNTEPGNIIVTDTLPAGLSFVSGTGLGWNCSASGQIVTCTRTGNLAVGTNTSTITLTVAVSAAALPSITNTASVVGTNFDNQSGNDQSTVTVTVNTGPNISLQKTMITIQDPVNGTTNPKAIPGALTEYTITATNTGPGTADNNSIIITDSIPSNTALFVGDISGPNTGPVRFIDGSPPSGLNYNYTSLADVFDNLSFSNNNGTSYNYVPTADTDGVDTSVTNIRISTLNQFLASGAAGDPSFNVLFRVKVQ